MLTPFFHRLRRLSGMRLVNGLLGTWTAVVLVFLYVPILVLAISSFNDAPPKKQWLNNGWEGATTRWYGVLWYGSVRELREIVGSGNAWYQRWPADALDALGAADAKQKLVLVNARIADSVGPIAKSMFNSLFIATIATAVSTVLGTAAAWLLYRFNYPVSRALNTLVAVPMIVPEIIMGISLLILFATLHWHTGFTTVIVSHITFCFPYVMITVQARLAGLDPSLEEAALDLGATPFVAFWRVIVPYLRPAIVSGGLMAFTLSMDDFVVTYFTYSARAVTFPLQVYGSIKYPNPLIMAVSTLLVGVTALAVIVSEFAKRRGT